MQEVTKQGVTLRTLKIGWERRGSGKDWSMQAQHPLPQGDSH